MLLHYYDNYNSFTSKRQQLVQHLLASPNSTYNINWNTEFPVLLYLVTYTNTTVHSEHFHKILLQFQLLYTCAVPQAHGAQCMTRALLYMGSRHLIKERKERWSKSQVLIRWISVKILKTVWGPQPRMWTDYLNTLQPTWNAMIYVLYCIHEKLQGETLCIKCTNMAHKEHSF